MSEPLSNSIKYSLLRDLAEQIIHPTRLERLRVAEPRRTSPYELFDLLEKTVKQSLLDQTRRLQFANEVHQFRTLHHPTPSLPQVETTALPPSQILKVPSQSTIARTSVKVDPRFTRPQAKPAPQRTLTPPKNPFHTELVQNILRSRGRGISHAVLKNTQYPRTSQSSLSSSMKPIRSFQNSPGFTPILRSIKEK